MSTRIVISSNTLWSVVNFRGRLIDALSANGYEVTVLAPTDKHALRLSRSGCKLVHLEMNGNGKNPLGDLALLARYVRLLERERPAVYLGYTVKPNVYGSLAAQMLGIPVINNIAGLGRAFIRPGPTTHIVRLLYRVALRRSRVVFFQNADDRQLFLQWGLVREARARLVPGSGVDLTHFTPPAPALSPEDGDAFCFLMIGRVLRDKGVEEYARAADIVRRRFPKVRFQLLGHIDDANPGTVPRDQLQQWQQAKLIDYLGDTTDVRPLIARADCVVLPSYREGVPRSLLEAAAMAKPLLTTDAVGCRDVVSDRVNGLLCKVGDASDLATKMAEMLSFHPDKRRRMGAAGRRKMESDFDDRLVITRYLDAIEHCLNRGTAALKPTPLDLNRS
jgi:glycosyltransferase involved in cell wall biosynthesis